jgi:probable rRNA maturation factor
MDRLQLEFSLIVEAETPAGVFAKHLEALTHFVLEAEGATGAWEISAVLVDDDRLQTLHRHFMDIDTPTDIMTFPFDPEPGTSPRGGELVISVDHVRTQADVWGMTPVGEVEFLVVHGVLHLLGWRDETDADRTRMLGRQSELIARWADAAGS